MTIYSFLLVNRTNIIAYKIFSIEIKIKNIINLGIPSTKKYRTVSNMFTINSILIYFL